MKRNSQVKVRQTTRSDIPKLVEVNRAAYPTMTEDNVVWAESHLHSHLRMFPRGQILAEINGKIVGGACSLIVSLGRDPYRPHTWSGITDSGFFTNHDPDGDTLYGADVFTHPDFRGKGVGHALYERRRQICRQFNLRRIIAGGRLWNYSDHEHNLTPEEYAYHVAAGELKDLVLSFQIREGFTLRGVIPNYLRDRRSNNFASFIEWLNPDYRPREAGTRKVRIACVQYKMRKVRSFADFSRQIQYFIDIAADYGSDFVLFPEFLTVQLLSYVQSKSSSQAIKLLSGFTSKFRELMKNQARKYGLTVIAGSHPVKIGKKLNNVTFICLPDGSVFEQPKIHITPNERKWWGISGGGTLGVIDTPKAKIGVQICYDIEFPEATRVLADEGAEIIFVPYCTDNRQGYLRVRYCAQARAIENQVYVCLAGSVGNLPDVENMDVNYSQAAVLTPSDFAFSRDGIAAEADSSEETVLVCDLDLNDLYDSRTTGTVTPRLDRRTDLFRLVTEFNKQTRAEPLTNGQPLGDQRDISDRK